MVFAVGRRADLERLPVERLGAVEAALIGVQHAQIVERLPDLGMLRAEGLLADLERAPMQALGLVVAAEDPVQLGQVVAALRHVGVIGPERPLAHRERVAIVGLGREIVALGVQDIGEVVDAGRAARIALLVALAQQQRVAEQPFGIAEAAFVRGAQAGLADLVPLVALRPTRCEDDREQGNEQADDPATRFDRHAPSHVDYPRSNHGSGRQPTHNLVNSLWRSLAEKANSAARRSSGGEADQDAGADEQQKGRATPARAGAESRAATRRGRPPKRTRARRDRDHVAEARRGGDRARSAGGRRSSAQ